MEYLSCAAVFVGVAGETIAGVKRLIKSEHGRVVTERIFVGVLLLGLVGELIGLAKASNLTGQIIDAVNERAAAANSVAAQAQTKTAGLEKEAAVLRKQGRMNA